MKYQLEFLSCCRNSFSSAKNSELLGVLATMIRRFSRRNRTKKLIWLIFGLTLIVCWWMLGEIPSAVDDLRHGDDGSYSRLLSPLFKPCKFSLYNKDESLTKTDLNTDLVAGMEDPDLIEDIARNVILDLGIAEDVVTQQVDVLNIKNMSGITGLGLIGENSRTGKRAPNFDPSGIRGFTSNVLVPRFFSKVYSLIQQEKRLKTISVQSKSFLYLVLLLNEYFFPAKVRLPFLLCSSGERFAIFEDFFRGRSSGWSFSVHDILPGKNFGMVRIVSRGKSQKNIGDNRLFPKVLLACTGLLVTSTWVVLGEQKNHMPSKEDEV